MYVCMYVCTNYYIHVLLRLARKKMGEPVHFFVKCRTASDDPFSLFSRFLAFDSVSGLI